MYDPVLRSWAVLDPERNQKGACFQDGWVFFQGVSTPSPPSSLPRAEAWLWGWGLWDKKLP